MYLAFCPVSPLNLGLIGVCLLGALLVDRPLAASGGLGKTELGLS